MVKTEHCSGEDMMTVLLKKFVTPMSMRYEVEIDPLGTKPNTKIMMGQCEEDRGPGSGRGCTPDGG